VVDDLHYLELTELAACIKAGKISPLEVTRAQLARIAAFIASCDTAGRH